MKKTVLWIMAALACLSSCKPKDNVTLHPELPFNIKLKGGFELEKQYNSGTGKTFVFKSADDYLMVTKTDSIDEEAATNYRIDKLSLINSLFTDQGTPYPGKLTNHQGCPDEFKPVVLIDAKDIYSLKLDANQRLVYGGCTDASAYYSSTLIFCYCQSGQTLFEIKYFTPIANPANDLKAVSESVGCP